MKGTDSVRCIKGVGEKAEKLYAKLGIRTVEDLLSHYPRSYDVYQPIQPVEQAAEGRVMVIEVSLAGRPQIAYIRNLKIISCTMRDASGSLPVSWFNMPIKYLKASGKGFFVEKEGYALAISDKLADIANSEAFKQQMKDILEYRTMEYYRRRYTDKD